jgi:hypothetical protein
MEKIMKRLAIALAAMVAASLPSEAWAEKARFTFLKTVSVSELNTILGAERAAFINNEVPGAGPGYQQPPTPRATNAIDVYTVVYETRIPERNNESVTVSGMLALPRLADRTKIPLMSYQHGTVYNKYAVPSYAFQTRSPWPYDHRAEAYETRYMAALFAGNGYGLVAADYVGFGVDARSDEAYLIKGVSAQASVDLVADASRYLATQKITPSNLFLSGWSQGALNTGAVLQKLESQGVKVRASFTAANPNDPYAAVDGVIMHSRPTDSPWFSALISQAVFSCEKFGGPAGLAKNTLSPMVYEDSKSIYKRSYGNPGGDPEVLKTMLTNWSKQKLISFLRPELRNSGAFAASDFGRCLARNEAYRQDIQSDVRIYYGTDDQIIRQRLGRLGAEYQLVVEGAPPTAQAGINRVAIPVQGGTHRLTFMSGSVEAKAWMDRLR